MVAFDHPLINTVKEHWPKLALGSAAVLFLLSIGFLFIKPSEPVNSGDSTASVSPGEISVDSGVVVDVAGAVVQPGVYQLPRTARVEQAILAAGGFDTERVDADYVAKQMNLAAKVTDGQKIYVAHEGENRSTIPAQAHMTSTLGTSTGSSGKVGINSASDKALIALPGIGEVTAKKIIDNRPYQSIEELTSKKVLTNSVYAKVADSLSLD